MVATDDAVLLVGVWLDPDSNAPSQLALRAAALPHGDTEWSVVPGGVLSPQSADAVSVSDYVLVVDYDGRAAQLSTIGWGEPVETGLADGECGPQLTLGNGPVLATKCLQVAAYELSTGQCTERVS